MFGADSDLEDMELALKENEDIEVALLSSTHDFDTRSMIREISKEGYRSGKEKEEELEMQKGFDVGFERAMALSRSIGKFYGTIKMLVTKLVEEVDTNAGSVNVITIAGEDSKEELHAVLSAVERICLLDIPDAIVKEEKVRQREEIERDKRGGQEGNGDGGGGEGTTERRALDIEKDEKNENGVKDKEMKEMEMRIFFDAKLNSELEQVLSRLDAAIDVMGKSNSAILGKESPLRVHADVVFAEVLRLANGS